MIPGRTLHRLARVLLPPDVCEQIIDAQLADFQHEWALSERRPALVVLAKGYYGFWRAMIGCGLAAGKIEADRRSITRVLAVSLGVTLLSIGWWALPQVLAVGANGKVFAELPRLRVRILNTWITGRLPIAVAFGVAAGIATLRAREAHRLRLRLLLAAMATSIVLGLAVGWILPLFNHAVNVAMGDCCSKWPMEYTLLELRQQHDLAPDYYITIAAPWATLLMTVFGLSIANVRWPLRIAFTIGGCWLYRVLVSPVQWPALHGVMPLALEAWVANLVVAVLAALSFVLTREPVRQVRLKADTTS